MSTGPWAQSGRKYRYFQQMAQNTVSDKYFGSKTTRYGSILCHSCNFPEHGVGWLPGDTPLESGIV